MRVDLVEAYMVDAGDGSSPKLMRPQEMNDLVTDKIGAIIDRMKLNIGHREKLELHAQIQLRIKEFAYVANLMDTIFEAKQEANS